MNHVNMTEASFDSTFAPIDDWNIINNLIEKFEDRVGPREKALYASQQASGRLHPERREHDAIPVVNRGSVQGNLTGFQYDIFENGDLTGLNLIPRDKIIRKEGIPADRKAVHRLLQKLRRRGHGDDVIIRLMRRELPTDPFAGD